LLLVIGVAAAGVVTSFALQGIWGIHVQDMPGSPLYGKFTSSLLAVGLFASSYGISRGELRRNARVVLIAVTLGVAIKAGIVGTIMAFAYGGVGFLLLGIAVAQIDPLSVAATLRRSGMSERAKAILAAWASFDDPVTILLVYAGSFLLPAVRHGSGAGLGPGAGSYLSQILFNVLLIGAAALLWSGLGRVPARFRLIPQCLGLVGLLVAAAGYGLLVGITVCGLFYRPRIAAALDRAVDFAFCMATFSLGLLLLTGINVLAGILLGVSVFCAQILVALAITRGLPRVDRRYLALGQQNGLTAIVLGLTLQPYLPQSVGIIAVSILTVNTLNIYSNRKSQVREEIVTVPCPEDQMPEKIGQS